MHSLASIVSCVSTRRLCGRGIDSFDTPPETAARIIFGLLSRKVDIVFRGFRQSRGYFLRLFNREGFLGVKNSDISWLIWKANSLCKLRGGKLDCALESFWLLALAWPQASPASPGARPRGESPFLRHRDQKQQRNGMSADRRLGGGPTSARRRAGGQPTNLTGTITRSHRSTWLPAGHNARLSTGTAVLLSY